MNNTIEYKGYEGSVEYSEADCVFYGKVLGVHALISYEGKNTETYLGKCRCRVYSMERQQTADQAEKI